MGDDIFLDGTEVNEQSLNLSVLLPEMEPQWSACFNIIFEGTLTAKSPVSLMSLWECLDGRMDIPMSGGSEHMTPHQAIVMILGLLLFLSMHVTSATGTGYNAVFRGNSVFGMSFQASYAYALFSSALAWGASSCFFSFFAAVLQHVLVQ